MEKKLLTLLEALTPDQAFGTLKLLAKQDKGLETKILQAAQNYLGLVNMEETAVRVRADLEGLDVHDVWDTAGEDSCGGYQDPGEVAWEMVENTLEPYIEQLQKYIKLRMATQAKEYCHGIVKGIKDYQQKSRSEFKDWAGDVFSQSGDEIMNIWKNGGKNRNLK